MSDFASATPIRIDVWSDIACPWCYIGKRNLQAGLEESSADEDAPVVEVVFHSYELAPDTDVDFDGSEIDFLAGQRNMDPAEAQKMLDNVTEIARGAGLEYRFDLLHHTNTGAAHELVHYAHDQGVQADVLERLMAAYFVEGRHLGQLDVLVDIAAEAGLPADEAREALTTHRYRDDVLADEARAQEIGVNAVPFFVIDDKYAVSGAQPVAAFAQIARRVWAEHREAASAEGSAA